MLTGANHMFSRNRFSVNCAFHNFVVLKIVLHGSVNSCIAVNSFGNFQLDILDSIYTKLGSLGMHCLYNREKVQLTVGGW